MKILLAFNGSRLSEAALRAVITQRRPESTEVKVLKVIPPDVTEEEVRNAQASLVRYRGGRGDTCCSVLCRACEVSS